LPWPPGVQLHTIGGFLATNTAFSDWGNILHSTTIVIGFRPGELLNLTLGGHNRSEAILHIRSTSSLSRACYRSTFGEQRMEDN